MTSMEPPVPPVETVPARRRSGWRPPIGALALGLALLFVVADAVAIAVSAQGQWVLGTLIAQAIIVATIASFALGIGAFVANRGRRYAAVAVVISILANPLVLTGILAFLDRW